MIIKTDLGYDRFNQLIDYLRERNIEGEGQFTSEFDKNIEGYIIYGNPIVLEGLEAASKELVFNILGTEESDWD